jgi:hypothetical protein
MFSVDISTNGGSSWTNEINWNEDHLTGEQVSIDLAAYLGEADVMARFRYAGNGWDWWAQVDDLALNCVIDPELDYGVELSGDDALSGEPDEAVTYTLTVTNTGDVMDTYTIAISDVWGAAAPADVTVDAGLSTTFDVTVTVPASAADGDSDVATVTVTSVNDGAATASADLTTTATTEESVFIIYLPVVLKP